MDLRKLGVLSLVVGLGAFAQGCGDPCVSLCEDEVDAGCSTVSDCDSFCEDAAADADATGCRSQFDDFIDCAAGEDACSGVATGACSTEATAYATCFVDFCLDNPDNAACTA